jgi:hypothetical protein
MSTVRLTPRSPKRPAAVLLLAALVLLVPRLGAQTNADGTPGGQYVINGKYVPTIANVQKIDLRPTAFDTVLPDRAVSYDLLPVKGTVPAKVDSISAVKLNIATTQERLYRGFVKAGFGLYTTPLAEVYFDQTRSRENAYGIHVKHFSSNGGLDDVGPSDYGYNNIDGFYTQYMKHHEVGGRLTYDRRRVNFYGYSPVALDDDTIAQPTDDELERFYNDIGFQARIKSLYRDGTKIAHDVALEVHAYSNDVRSTETNLKLTAQLGKEEGTESYGLGIVLDNNAYRGKLGNGLEDLRQNGTLFGLTPSVSTSGEKYMVKVGAGIYVDAQGKTTFHFFPQAEASYRLFDDILMPYVGVDGRRIRNSFRSLSRENPWMVDAPDLVNSSLNYDIYGGLRGSFSSQMGFDVRISKSRMKARPLFVSLPPGDPSFGDQFAPVYDRVDQLDISGELHYHAGSAIQVNGRVDIYTYDTDEQAEPWNLPPYKISLGATYDLRQKLILKLEAQFLGARKALGYEDQLADVPVATTRDLDGFMDLYFGAEYRYTKRLSLFVDVSNLSASKYERWYRYPVQRTLFMGGATFAF